MVGRNKKNRRKPPRGEILPCRPLVLAFARVMWAKVNAASVMQVCRRFCSNRPAPKLSAREPDRVLPSREAAAAHPWFPGCLKPGSLRSVTAM